ncbi:MAG: DNA-binding protein [Paenibacillus sp.]|nr:DNA-binding protein [Paenibacillus sp.]
MNDRDVLFGLHELEGVGWKTIQRLAQLTSGKFANLIGAGADDFIAWGMKPNIAHMMGKGLSEQWIEQRRQLYTRQRIEWVTTLEPHYPTLLREIAQPPWVLYYKGDIRIADRPAIAMVGTRTPTAYGKKVAFDLAVQLSAAGVCVVSGLARGIDSCAHRGALLQKGGTAAVLGCGIDAIYPPENASLSAEIACGGVVISEYPIGTKLHPGLFPQRNRIISGLSLGTVVVEAASRSGSLITADQALEQSRDVFAVPGPITSPKSSGTLELIRQGAKMVAGVEHILEEYRHLFPSAETAENKGQTVAAPHFLASDDERKVLDAVSASEVSFDELLGSTGFEFGHLHSVLLNLILKKKIVPLPGSSYMLL